MELIELEKKADYPRIVSENTLVLIDFFATWCGPCQMLSPILHEVADEHPSLIVLKVDVDDFPEIASEFDVFSIPTLVLFKDGKPVNKKVGFLPKEALLDFIK